MVSLQHSEAFGLNQGDEHGLLGGSWVVISGVISPLIGVITIVTLIITPLIALARDLPGGRAVDNRLEGLFTPWFRFLGTLLTATWFRVSLGCRSGSCEGKHLQRPLAWRLVFMRQPGAGYMDFVRFHSGFGGTKRGFSSVG